MKDEDWDTDTVIVWSIALADLQMTASEFAAAKRKSLGLQWAPTAPADFLALGRTQQASEYPSAQAAFDNACSQCGIVEDQYVKRKWAHAVVLETANRIGWGRLKGASNYFLREFTDIYEQVISEHQNGATFVIPESHQVEYERTVVQPDSPFNSELNDFFAKFGSKSNA